MTKKSEVPLCPKCGERHWRHEPCEKPISYHDFRDRGDPSKKIDPDPNHWSRWPERPDK